MRTVRGMGRNKSKTGVITWVRELTSWKGKVFGDLGIWQKKLLHSPRAVDPLLQRLALLTTTYWFLSPKRLENLLVVVKLNNLKTLKKAWFNMNSAFSISNTSFAIWCWLTRPLVCWFIPILESFPVSKEQSLQFTLSNSTSTKIQQHGVKKVGYFDIRL